MLHERLAHYLNAIEQTILTYPDLYIDRYTEEILTRDRANLRIRIRIKQNNLLEINEAVIIIDDWLITLDNRYHYQNEKVNSSFVTTAPHFQEH